MITTLAVVSAACGAGTPSAPPATGSVAPSAAVDAIGVAEKATLTIAIPFPDVVMYGRYWIAEAEGYLKEEGLTVEVVTADDTIAAVISGSADLGVQSAGAAILAIDQGLDAQIVGGHSCQQDFAFATQPAITKVEDLAGKDIVLAGTAGDPAQFEREKVLRDAGWDVTAVGANPVYPGPDSATWREFFLAGTIALMPYYSDDVAALKTYGAAFPITEIKAWPNDVYVAKTGWVDANPNAAARFFRAVMKATKFMHDPALGQQPGNKTRILEIWEANDLDTADRAASDDWTAIGQHNYCENLYYDKAGWDTSVSGQNLKVSATFESGANLSAMLAAQAALGLTNEAPGPLEH